MLLKIMRYYFPFLAIIKKKLHLMLYRENPDGKKNQKANARYCYSVWLRHLSIMNDYGFNTKQSIIAELGPGDSLGVGLMALLTGSNKYYALDVVKKTNLENNAILLDELIDLLLNRTDIPNEEEFPNIHPNLKSYTFPSKIITEEKMEDKYYEGKVKCIKDNLLHYETLNNKLSPIIKYYCPWYNSNIINKESVDVIFSQAVLEHVDDIRNTYEAMYLWLKPGGVMSHQIDFTSHGTSDKWNGHWAYSDYKWKIIVGNSIYLLNRGLLSTHIDLLNKTGFEILSIIPNKTWPSGQYVGPINRNQLATRFQKMSEEDFITCGAHILSIKQ